jgi:CheY-like chemotaxis protein
MGKILVIDDDPVVRSVIGRVLSREGYELLFASDGEKGLRTFKVEQPDLVICDIIMPEREGIETIRAMMASRPDASIIAISGGGRLANADFLSMAAAFGAKEVLAKPFAATELTEAVRRVLHPQSF